MTDKKGKLLRFLLATLHKPEYKALVAHTGDELPLEPFTIQCPKCGVMYLAELAPEDEPFDLEEQEWEALVKLQRECPDHAHRFAV